MAGSFGFEAAHQMVSMQMAENTLMPAIRRQPDAVVVADGTSCRHQIADGAQRRAVHVAVCLPNRSDSPRCRSLRPADLRGQPVKTHVERFYICCAAAAGIGGCVTRMLPKLLFHMDFIERVIAGTKHAQFFTPSVQL